MSEYTFRSAMRTVGFGATLSVVAVTITFGTFKLAGWLFDTDGPGVQLINEECIRSGGTIMKDDRGYMVGCKRDGKGIPLEKTEENK